MEGGKVRRVHNIPRREEREGREGPPEAWPAREPLPAPNPRRGNEEEEGPILVPNWPVRKPERVKRDGR